MGPLDWQAKSRTSLKRSTRITLTAALPNPLAGKTNEAIASRDSPGTKPAMFSSISLGES